MEDWRQHLKNSPLMVRMTHFDHREISRRFEYAFLIRGSFQDLYVDSIYSGKSGCPGILGGFSEDILIFATTELSAGCQS